MSKIFPKIYLKFYSNVTTHIPNLLISLVISLQHILFLVIRITILVVIPIQYFQKRHLRFKSLNHYCNYQIINKTNVRILIDLLIFSHISF